MTMLAVTLGAAGRGAILTDTPVRAALAVAALAIVATATSRVRIDLRGGGVVPLSLPVLIAGPAIFDVRVALAGLLAGIAGGAALDLRERRPVQATVVLALVPVAAGVAGHLAVGEATARNAMLVAVCASGSATVLAEVTARWRGWLRLPRSEAGETFLVLLSLWSAGGLLGVTAERSGPLGALIPFIPMALIAASYRSAAEARRTADETLDALATLPEVTGDVPPGHGPRLLSLVEAVADVKGMSWHDREQLRAAARLHRLDNVVADPSPIFEQVGVEGSQLQLIQAVGRPARRPYDRLPALVRVADTFTSLTAVPGTSLGEAIAGLREAHSEGREAQAADDIVAVLNKRPRLVTELLAGGDPIVAAAAEATD